LWMEKNTKRWIPIAFAQLINATLPSQSTYSTINPTKSVTNSSLLHWAYFSWKLTQSKGLQGSQQNP
jgi:hypothetical protein